MRSLPCRLSADKGVVANSRRSLIWLRRLRVGFMSTTSATPKQSLRAPRNTKTAIRRRRTRLYRRRHHAALDGGGGSRGRWRCSGIRRWKCRQRSTTICRYETPLHGSKHRQEARRADRPSGRMNARSMITPRNRPLYPPITTIATEYAFRLRSKSFGG